MTKPFAGSALLWMCSSLCLVVAACGDKRAPGGDPASDDGGGGVGGEAQPEPAKPAVAMPSATVGGKAHPVRSVLLVEDAATPGDRTNQILLTDAAPAPHLCSARFLEDDQFELVLGTRAAFTPGLKLTHDADGDGEAWVYGGELRGADRPDFDNGGELAVELTAVDRERRVARGSIHLSSDTVVIDGSFEAVLCPTKFAARDEAAPIHGVAHTMELVDPAGLPAEPAEGFIFDGFSIAYTNVMPWNVGNDNRWVLTWFRERPDKPCTVRSSGYEGARVAGGPRRIKRIGAATDSFSLFIPGDALVTGKTIASRNVSGTPAPDPDPLSAWATWVEPDGARGSSYAQYYSGAIALDAVDEAAGVARGRVYLAMPYASKPLLVGGFEAKICPEWNGE